VGEVDPDCGYEDWLKVGMALHHQFNGDVEACEAWDRWSQGPDGGCGGYTPGLCDSKWRSFGGSGTTLRSLVFKANQKKLDEALQRGEIVLDQAPVSHARKYLETLHTGEEGVKLVHYADDYFVHRRTHYEEIEEATIRSQVYKFLDRCSRLDRKGNVVPFQPTPASVSAAMDATKALVHLPNQVNTKPPVWLEGYGANKPEAGKLISLKNGLFHLEESVLMPHSLGFFTLNSLPFEYDPQATCPQWLNFLDQVWGHDPQSIDCLQEIFGYILSGDTRQQKFFNLIGPRRSGKGTINKVLVELLGQHNTVAPELGELCDNFGLQPWLGKLLASFTDARAPERNRGSVVSQLLRIVGGDTVTVNRKNKEAWNGYLPTRIIIYSNEMLQLTENSNALTGRMIVLRMTKTFYGNEDTNLSAKLMSELSGIFNWCMEGLRRRVARGGQFIQPESGLMALHDMEEQANPIGAFFEATMELDELSTLEKDDVFAVFKRWANLKGIHPGTELSFKRRFLAAVQDKPINATTQVIDGERVYVYQGVSFRRKAKAFLNGLGDYKEDLL
jgi:putative DNA primase/helicase